MQTFLIIWLGQFASLLGSEMTNFAITIWAWDVTGKATPLALILVVTQIPRLLISPFAGIWVDRFNRKYLMLLGDTLAGLSTIVLLILFTTGHLQIWHLYISSAINGLFGHIQGLAYATSVSLIVPKHHYVRASALKSLQMSGGYLFAPAMAGALYAITGLGGILTFDLVTFGIATISLSTVAIPQPTEQDSSKSVSSGKMLEQLTFGVRYLWRNLSLKTLLSFIMIMNIINSICQTILPAMLLARSGNNTTAVGTLFSCFGAGGLLGGVILSIWGGPKRRIHGLLIADAISKTGLIMLALAQQTYVRLGAALVGGFCLPFSGSCSEAIWQSKIEPEKQGRVFAARFLLSRLVTPLGAMIAGPLADYAFEPAMQPGGALTKPFGNVLGVGLGAGMALQMLLFASLGVLISLGGYGVRSLRQVED
ncbi:MFS transporter [Leptothoe sp. EHU-05/26/07-4]